LKVLGAAFTAAFGWALGSGLSLDFTIQNSRDFPFALLIPQPPSKVQTQA